MYMRERIKKYLKVKGVSTYRFAKSVGVSDSYLSSRCHGISAKILGRIVSAYPDLNGDWVATGEGTMLRYPPADGSIPIAEHIEAMRAKDSEITRLRDEVTALKQALGYPDDNPATQGIGR